MKLLKALKFHLSILTILAVTICIFTLAAFGSSNSPVPPVPAAAQGTLYVVATASSTGKAQVLRFTGLSALADNAAPAATIAGDLTFLESPAIALDRTSDRLFALVSMGRTAGAILVFDHASLKSGNVFPDRIISGRATFIRKTGVFAVDRTRNLLYAGSTQDADGQVDILVFNNAAAANGNVPPSAVLNFGSVGIRPTDMVLDEANDRLFIADTANEIQVFDHASSRTSGTMTPSRTISGYNGVISRAMYHIALDPAGRLLVSAGGVSVDIYADAATANGNITPVARIMGSNTQFNVGGPGALTVFTGAGASPGGDLYVSTEDGKVLVFTNIDKANGNVAPARVLSVNTNAGELGLAVDASR